MRYWLYPCLLAAVGLYAGCTSGTVAPEPWTWDLPSGIAPPPIPADNPLTRAKVFLGRRLFFDARLSGNGRQSCESCHHQRLGFSDGRSLAVGSTGQTHPRNAPGLVNVAYFTSLTWANPVLDRLEKQVAVPLVSEDPVEMGLVGHDREVLARFEDDPSYLVDFRAAFPDVEEPVSLAYIIRALASFLRTFNSFDAPYDRFLRGDQEAMSVEARRGLELFSSERLRCAKCHAGLHLTAASVSAPAAPPGAPFFNTGLYNADGRGAYPLHSPGLYGVSGKVEDMGRFRVPSLRNVAVTAPYFHDGSAGSLLEVIEVYERGGRLVEGGPFAGDGARSPVKSSLIRPFSLSPEEKVDLVAFLSSLTDEGFLNRESLSKPSVEPRE